MSELPSTPDWVTELIDVLETQHGVIRQLAEVADQQAALIAERRTSALVSLLERRQTHVDAVVAGQERLTSLTADLGMRLRTVATPQRERITELMEQVTTGLEQVMKTDRADQAAIESARTSMREEMQDMDRAHQARRAYVNAARIDNRFADRKG